MRITILVLMIYCGSMNVQAQSDGKSWQIFEEADLLTQRAQLDGPYLPFLNESSLSMGIYELEVGATDKQNPHDQDEVYYVLEGKATIKVEGELIPVKKGSTVFVKAHANHSFIDIEDTLKLLVFFSTGPLE